MLGKTNVCLLLHLRRVYLVTEADGQLVEWYRMRTVGSEENLELDGLIYMETGRLELGLTLDWSQKGEDRVETSSYTLRTITITHLKIKPHAWSFECLTRLSFKRPKHSKSRKEMIFMTLCLSQTHYHFSLLAFQSNMEDFCYYFFSFMCMINMEESKKILLSMNSLFESMCVY